VRELWEKNPIAHFYESLEDMEDGLRTYIEYYNKFRPHMGLHGLTPYEKLKGLLGGKTQKDFEVSNILPFDKILNFDTKM